MEMFTWKNSSIRPMLFSKREKSYIIIINILNILNSRPTQGRVKGWDAMKPHIIGPWVARVQADHAWHTITRADEMKRNGWDECGEMVEWNLW